MRLARVELARYVAVDSKSTGSTYFPTSAYVYSKSYAQQPIYNPCTSGFVFLTLTRDKTYEGFLLVTHK